MIPNFVKQPLGFLRSKLDQIRYMSAGNIVWLGATVIAIAVSYISWGPLRWYLFTFIPEDASGGWMAQLIITIVLGWVGGIALPFAIFVFGFICWMQDR